MPLVSVKSTFSLLFWHKILIPNFKCYCHEGLCMSQHTCSHKNSLNLLGEKYLNESHWPMRRIRLLECNLRGGGEAYMGRAKRIWYLSPMRAAKVQASLRIRAVSPEPSLLAHTSSESRGTFRQTARSLAPLNGWACVVKMCHDRMLEDTNSLGGAYIIVMQQTVLSTLYSRLWTATENKQNSLIFVHIQCTMFLLFLTTPAFF